MSEHYVPISAKVKNTEGCRLATCHDAKQNCQAILVALVGLGDEGAWSYMPKEYLIQSCEPFSRVDCPNFEAVLAAIQLEK